jgi:soluble lytic murein transglycosylase-like protein/tetratricopeptide (TPR) repeat protein
MTTNLSLKSEATLSAARVLLELEKPADVRILLEPFVGSATGRDVIARYLLARAYAALGLWHESLQQYDAYIQSGRVALPYAYLDRARVLLELGQNGPALTSVQTGLGLGVPAAARLTFMLTIAQINERAGAFPDAIRSYQNLIDASASDSDDALALSRIVALKRMFVDPTYVEELKRLLAGYPTTDHALTALNEATARGEPVDPTIRGLIHYRHNDYTRAEPAFREQIASAPDSPFSASAYYYLAAIQEARQQLDDALANYARVSVLDPASSVADDSLWWRARILEDRGNAVDAQGLFARITGEYPNSTWAPDAAFRRGMLSYGAGRYQEAADIWGRGQSSVAAVSERQRLTFWQGKALLKAGNREAGRPALEQLAQSGEDDYYGVRAGSLLQNRHDQPKATREAKLDLAQSYDWPAAEAWLSTKVGRLVNNNAWANDQRWARALELWTIGRNSQGDLEAFDLIETHGRDPVAMYTLARHLQTEGRVSMSARAGQRLVAALDTNPNAGLPKALLSLSYPAAFGTLAQKHAQNERISPLLLLAFVRQESFFNPRAESPVGALGLTQVVPATGVELASRLGVRDFASEDLLHADLNLRLGASYMAQSLRDLDNELFVAFSAYNAGQSPSRRWRQTAGKDADVFLEQIEYTETRRYVEIVAENYAIYRYLYGGESTPNLPE